MYLAPLISQWRFEKEDKTFCGASKISLGKKAFGGLASRFGKKKESQAASESVESQLRSLKGLLDDGIISQEEFDAKKRQLLGL